MASTTRQALLQALSAAEGAYISGQQLAQQLGVSRAAVHKAAAALTAQGYALEAAPRRGYRLAGGDPFCAEAVGEYPAPIYLYDTLESSNLTAKQLALAGAPHGTLVLAGQQKAGRGRFRIRPASAFAPERAAYLVQPYLPRGMVSILGGVSAAGKTSLALDVCARLTRGAAFAPDTPPQPPATVLYLTAENDPNKVLRPRAEAMGADLDRLYFQDGASYSMGDEELAALCRVYRPALLVFDPIQSYLGQGVQMLSLIHI